MVAKLKAYRLANGWDSEIDLTLLQGLSAISISGNPYVRYDLAGYTEAQVRQIDDEYGVIFREFVGTGGGGGETRSAALEFTSAGLIATSPWTDGYPIAGTVRMYGYRTVYPILANMDEEIDVSDLLLEDNIEITRQIESLEKFDLRVSRASFQLHNSDALTTFLNKYWNPDGYLQAQYVLNVELEGYFFGVSDFENINYDAVQETYFFDTYDPLKWLQKNIWNLKLPSYGVGGANLDNFLTRTCGMFTTFGKSVNIEVDTSQYWTIDYIGGYYGSYYDYYYVLDLHLNIGDFIVELFKHYGAAMYYDESGNLNFVKRDKYNSVYYDESVMLDELNKSYEGSLYNSLLVNISEDGTNWTVTAWALIWEDNGFQFKQLVNESDIPTSMNYLDLRQELPDKTAEEYRVFQPRTKEEMYSDYKELMKSSAIYETTLDGRDYKLYDVLNIGGQDYVINYAQIDFSNENTKVRCYKKI